MEESSILYIDLEVVNEKIAEIGLVIGNQELKTTSINEAKSFLKRHPFEAVCGHNIFAFDLRYINQSSLHTHFKSKKIIDTLPISLLLFSQKTFHALPKKYKSEDNFQNDPLKDAKLTKELLQKAKKRFQELQPYHQTIFFSLLHEQKEFQAFFDILDQKPKKQSKEQLYHYLKEEYGFDPKTLAQMLHDTPIELAYIVSVMTPLTEIHAIPPYILHHYPSITTWQEKLLQNQFSEEALNEFMHQTFGFLGFREFPRLNPTLEKGSFLSQKEIVQSAIQKRSLIAVLPTGGGKTFTFWLPALFRAQKLKTLTVVISPLQALMKDQIENFEKQVANFKAVAISGYQNALERSEAIEKVMGGEADILYIAPESLRSQTIFSLLKNRVIDRFVIDEAHCLSTWGHDFRHDYFYIAEFIQDLLKEHPWCTSIPVSCFTATAKPNVIEDIKSYFKQKLGLELEEFLAKPERTNLSYKTFLTEKEDIKYTKTLEILNQRQVPTLIYVPSSTKKCEELAQRLSLDIAPRRAAPFHAKLDKEVKNKILQEYINGEIDVIVATTAFGMGIDKPDIQTVIHYEISDSLENYAQEAGRGARDKNLEAFCPILFDQKDLDKHFATLNRNKVTVNEINSIFQVIKNLPSKNISLTPRELAELAGWDIEGENDSWDIKVKTALLELEREGYLQRKRNRVRFFADAVAKNGFEKLEALKESLSKEQFILLKEVLNAILGRGKPASVEVDEIALILGYKREEVASAILQLKELSIVQDAKDMLLYLYKDAQDRFRQIEQIENALLDILGKNPTGETTIRSLNNNLLMMGVVKESENASELIKELLKMWRSKAQMFSFYRIDRQNDLWHYEVKSIDLLQKSIAIKHDAAKKVLNALEPNLKKERSKKVAIEFSLIELAKQCEHQPKLIDKTLLFLHRTGVLELAQGRFIYYSPMQIEKTDKFKNKAKYTKKEYEKRLKSYYRQKTEAIHIVGEFAKKMASNPQDAKEFLQDYFTLNYEAFKRRYKLLKAEITRPITKWRYEKIFGSLSSAQKEIIEDNEHDTILILAGPGSGKTKVLVHKIASLILKEDVNPDQFLMLTFSRSAANEFRTRLYDLIGPLAKEVEIKTFHSYALQLIGREVAENDDVILHDAIKTATRQIKNGIIHPPMRSVLMLDEFQDINEETFELVKTLYEAQEGSMKIIAVGDDDQCILESVNGANIAFFEKLEQTFNKGEGGFKRYLLTQNFRSTPQIISAAHEIANMLETRLKIAPIEAMQDAGREVKLIYSEKPLQSAVANFNDSIKDYDSTAFLAFSNEEVAQLYSLLYERGHKPQYLIARKGYRLKNLAEIYDFHQLLLASNKREFSYKELIEFQNIIKKRYQNSKNLFILDKMLQNFFQEYQHYYFHLWENFLDEIDFAEFEESGRLVVSTMHKAKGKEFDQVVVAIGKRKVTQEWLRLLYVAFTRAKKELAIITEDESLFQRLQKNPHIHSKTDPTPYHNPKTYTHIMGLDDVVLSFSYYSSLNPQERVVAGTQLSIDPPYIINNSKKLEKLSRKCTSILEERLQCGYRFKEIEAEAIVYWKDREKNIVLPHLLGKIILQVS